MGARIVRCDSLVCRVNLDIDRRQPILLPVPNRELRITKSIHSPIPVVQSFKQLGLVQLGSVHVDLSSP